METPHQHPLREPIAVLGGGVEGKATIRYLLDHGYRQLELRDQHPVDGLPEAVTAVCGNGHLDGLERFATIIRTPGIRPDIAPLAAARSQGVRVTSALSIFLANCPAPVIGVTGTLGKGTACSLAAAALRACGFTVHLGGNIGVNPLDFADSVQPDHRVILEISSFQAMDIESSPTVGAILTTTSEHLNWHTDTAEYRRAKAQMLAHQTPSDTVVFHADSPGAAEIAATSKAQPFAYSLQREVSAGLFLRNDRFILRMDGREETLPIDPARVAMRGRFNLENIAAAVLVALRVGGRTDAVCRAVSTFEGLPHRLECVGQYRSIHFFNDSYATRPEATIGAIAAFDEPIALILGGSEKNADFAELVDAIRARTNIRTVCLIGQTASRLEDELRRAGVSCPLSLCATLEDAVDKGITALNGSGVVLLSPACASFGLFANYKERGERFRAIAEQRGATADRT